MDVTVREAAVEPGFEGVQDANLPSNRQYNTV